MALSLWQNDLVRLLTEKGVSREDIFSVMLVLTKEEKAREMIAFLEEKKELTSDEICQKAGEIAFGQST